MPCGGGRGKKSLLRAIWLAMGSFPMLATGKGSLVGLRGFRNFHSELKKVGTFFLV